MSLAPSPSSPSSPGAPALPANLVVPVADIDLTRRIVSRTALESYVPHRGQMLLLDAVVWHNPEFTQGVAVKHVRDDEFWVPGHFPGRPMMPGVLQIEAVAQLCVYLYNARRTEPLTAAFTRIENCSFRSMVVPGSDLFLLCREIKWTRRGFICHVQGLCNQKLSFDAEIHGLSV